MADAPHHRLSAHCRLGSLTLDADINLTAPWTLLFGPSGSGKSSLLRAACGLLQTGGIAFTRFHAAEAQDPPEPPSRTFASAAPPRFPSSTSLENTPTHQRSLSWAPQHASLFPHLTVLENIAFAPRTTRALITDAIHLFRLDHLTSRRPRDLSGGERQRVSLARAFATPNCKLMLLDEPFSGIDHTLRDDLLPAMRAWLRDRSIPTLSVSHNVEEALQLEAEVILLRDGKVEAQGPAPEVLQTERNRLLHNLSAL